MRRRLETPDLGVQLKRELTGTRPFIQLHFAIIRLAKSYRPGWLGRLKLRVALPINVKGSTAWRQRPAAISLANFPTRPQRSPI